MGKYKLIALGLVLSVGATFGLATASQAKWSDSVRGQDRVEVAAGQTHEGSLYAAGEQILINGTVEGDLYCAGRDLILSQEAEVTGSILCAVQSATIDGSVGQDIRLAGQYLSVNSEIGGSLTFFGQDLKLLADSSVAGDVNGAGQVFNLGGPVGGDVVVAVERLSLQSTVAGSVDAGVNRIELLGGATVGGDLNYSSETSASIDESKVAGAVSFNQASHQQSEASAWGWLVFLLASMLACALIIALLAPHFVERSRAAVSRKYAIVSLVGFAVVFGTPILAIMLMMTVVLLPVGLLLMLLWVSIMLVSHGFFAYWLGSLAFAGQRNVLIRMAAGVAILFVLYLIPVVNFFAIIFATVIGSGMVVTTITDGYKAPQYVLADLSAKKPAAKKRKESRVHRSLGGEQTMVDKRDKFQVVKNPLEAQRQQLETLGRQFQALGINFYPANKVPDEADTIYFYVVTEELLGGKPGHSGKTLRQQLDDSRGSAGWAVTPSTQKDGHAIDGLVDVVETVDPDKIARMPSARQAEIERRQQRQQNIGQPVLRIVQNDADPTD